MGKLEFRDILAENIDTIINYITNQSKALIVLLIDKEKNILDCSKGFLNIFNLKEKPLNQKLSDFLFTELDIFNNCQDLQQKSITLNLNLLDKILFPLSGYLIPLQGEIYLIFLEKYEYTYNYLVEKMAILTDELLDLNRNLEKKNQQLLKANLTIKKIMNIDPLTGLLNRRAFKEKLMHWMYFSRRHKIPISLVMADIDHFKYVNDNFGHDIGDKVLKKFAKKLAKSCRAEDVVSRFGGEEFLLLLTNTNSYSAFIFAERLRKNIETIKIPKIPYKITASFGISELLPSDTEDTLIKRVDEALYDAKRSGRNRCVLR
ncbi:MAG: GGDEF domain-containing protein [Thermodesulfovibrionales bacterium]|nr:GGDEF domain-containing protein [Thermodesulfovibrionales bacterium]